MNHFAQDALRIATDLNAAVLPVSIEKKPALRRWQNLSHFDSIQPKRLLKFGSDFPNVGIVLGQASFGLCSIDCDSSSALADFLACNPMLHGTLVTKAHRGGNVWVRISGPYPRLSKITKMGQPWGEWRADGGYTVIHGTHKEGMTYAGNGNPVLLLSFDQINWPDGVILIRNHESKSPNHPANSTEILNSESLNSCIAVRLYNIGEQNGDISKPPAQSIEHESGSVASQTILANIENRRSAEEKLQARSPGLLRLYATFIEYRFQGMAGARNAFLVQAVPFLYRAVAPNYVLDLVMHFFDCNRALFHDGREQHQREALSLLEGVDASYPVTLTSDEQLVYDKLQPEQRIAFRICRDLALLPEPSREAFTFFLGCNQLAGRMGLHPPQAQRLLQYFTSIGLIKRLSRGSRWSPGSKAEASTYQWLLPSPLP